MDSPPKKMSAEKKALIVLGVLIAAAIGAVVWRLTQVSKHRNQFIERYHSKDMDIVRRYAPEGLDMVERQKRKAEGSNALTSAGRICKLYRDADAAIARAVLKAQALRDRGADVENEFAALLEEAKAHDLDKHSPGAWQQVQEINRAAEKVIRLDLDLALSKLNKAIALLKQAKTAYPAMEEYGKVRTKFDEMRKTVPDEDWSRNLPEEFAALDSAAKQVGNATAKGDWAEALERCREAVGLIEAGRKSFAELEPKAKDAAQRFGRAFRAAESEGLGTGAEEAWDKLVECRRTVRDAYKERDFRTTATAAEEGLQLIEKLMGTVKEAADALKESLTELTKAYAAARKFDKYLTEKHAEKWEEAQKAYEEIRAAVAAGKKAGIRKRADRVSKTLAELLESQAELVKDSAKTVAALKTLISDPRTIILDGNFPDLWKQIEQRKAELSRPDAQELTQETLESYAKLYSLLNDALDKLQGLEREIRKIKAECAARRQKYGRGIEVFRPADAKRMDALTAEIERCVKKQQVVRAHSLAKELSDLTPAQRFTHDGKSTVTDNVLGVMWIRDGRGAGCNGGRELSWDDALTWVDDLLYAGRSDWRLPTGEELKSLLELPLDQRRAIFARTVRAPYWSSTAAKFLAQALAVDLVTGKKLWDSKQTKHCIRPVRAPRTGMAR